MNAAVQSLSEKIQTLSPKQISEVDDFIEHLRQHESLTRAASSLSTPAFAAVWNNPEDEAYDAL